MDEILFKIRNNGSSCQDQTCLWESEDDEDGEDCGLEGAKIMIVRWL